MDFEKELHGEKAIEKAAVKFEKELQVEEDAALATRLSTPVGSEEKKKKKEIWAPFAQRG